MGKRSDGALRACRKPGSWVEKLRHLLVVRRVWRGAGPGSRPQFAKLDPKHCTTLGPPFSQYHVSDAPWGGVAWCRTGRTPWDQAQGSTAVPGPTEAGGRGAECLPLDRAIVLEGWAGSWDCPLRTGTELGERGGPGFRFEVRVPAGTA